jgi:hypothetical protein
MIDAPDASPAIAALLDEAAFNADRQWFKSRPDRSYRARLATQQEVAALHASGAWPRWTLDPACFIWAIVRSRTGTEALYVVLPPPTHEPREDELRHMWGRAAVAIARGTGQ